MEVQKLRLPLIYWHSGFAEAIVDKLEPNAEKKLPSTSTSLQLRLADIVTDNSAASVTNSQPEREDK